MATQKQKQKIEPQKITVMTVLANCKTGDSRRLLRKYGQEDAKSHDDLEYKLSKLVTVVDDKFALEKELANMHPHKDLILKHCAPKPIVEEIKVEAKEEPKPITTVTAEKIITDPSSNFGGCSCNKSGFDGSMSYTQTPPKPMDNDRIVMFGMFGLISILALVLVTKK